MNYHEAVRRFHVKFGHPSPCCVELSSVERTLFRAKLVREEADEVGTALERLAEWLEQQLGTEVEMPDELLGDVAGELCDLLYVAFGTAVNFGFDLAPFFELVQRANMAKARNPDGFGKPVKPDDWKKPDVRGEMLRAIREGRRQ